MRSGLFYAPWVVLFLLVAPSTKGQQLSNDPPSYFGGEDNQAYLDWLENDGITSSYSASTYIPSMNAAEGAAVHWRLDSQYIHLAIAVRATGWAGFGISEAGGMLGSDMALFVKSKPTQITDAHVVENRLPADDDCQQDWEFVASYVDETDFLMFETRRRLDTGDPQDKSIVDDANTLVPAHRIIAAWGDGANSVGYHGSKVARGSVRFYSAAGDDSLFQETMARDSEGSFSLLAPDYPIPAVETTYGYFCFTRDDITAQNVPNTALNMIGFGAVLSPDSAAYVHHFVVSASSDESATCFSDGRTLDNVVFGKWTNMATGRSPGSSLSYFCKQGLIFLFNSQYGHRETISLPFPAILGAPCLGLPDTMCSKSRSTTTTQVCILTS